MMVRASLCRARRSSWVGARCPAKGLASYGFSMSAAVRSVTAHAAEKAADAMVDRVELPGSAREMVSALSAVSRASVAVVRLWARATRGPFFARASVPGPQARVRISWWRAVKRPSEITELTAPVAWRVLGHWAWSVAGEGAGLSAGAGLAWPGE